MTRKFALRAGLCLTHAPSGNAHEYRPSRERRQDQRVGADLGVIADHDIAEHSSARANIDATSYDWSARLSTGSQRHLLKDQAVWADAGSGVNHDSVWVRDQQAPTDFALEGDFGCGDDRPEPMLQRPCLLHQAGGGAFSLAPGLILADRLEKSSAWVPKGARYFARPIWQVGGGLGSHGTNTVALRIRPCRFCSVNNCVLRRPCKSNYN